VNGRVKIREELRHGLRGRRVQYDIAGCSKWSGEGGGRGRQRDGCNCAARHEWDDPRRGQRLQNQTQKEGIETESLQGWLYRSVISGRFTCAGCDDN
jgi:hypothetical protein